MKKSPELTDIFPLPDEAKTLQVLIGDWIVDGTLTFEGRLFRVNGMAKLTSAAAGWGVMNSSRLGIEGVGSYEEVDVLGFDPDERLFHFFSVTNTGAARDHKGGWRDDSTISFRYEGLRDRKPYTEEIRISIHGSEELTIYEKDILDGQVVTIIDVRLKR